MSLLVLSRYLLRLLLFVVIVSRLFESLKDYVSKALISTIDHLGSVTSKVDTFLDENIDEAFETNLRVLCIQQVLKRPLQTYLKKINIVLCFPFMNSRVWFSSKLLQRLQTCQTYSDHEGFSQQSLMIQIPKYHKQYLLPGRFSFLSKIIWMYRQTLTDIYFLLI